MIQWIKNLGLSAKNYLTIAGLAFIGGLFVLLRLKDSKIHELEVENMRERFKGEQEKAAEKSRQAEEAYEQAKKNLE